MAWPRAAAMRSSVSTSNAPAQCRAVSSPRLWPTAVSASMPEIPQQGERRHGRGDDRRLRHLGRAEITLPLGGPSVLIEVPHRREPATPGSSVERRRRPLAGEEEPDPGRALALARGRRQPSDRAIVFAWSSTRPERLQPRLQLGRPAATIAARTVHPLLERSGQVGGQVGQLGQRELPGEYQELVDLPAQVGDVAPSEQEQLGVLGRAEEHASTGLRRRAPAIARDRLQDDVGVDPSEAHGADARPQRAVRRPGSAFLQHAAGPADRRSTRGAAGRSRWSAAGSGPRGPGPP